MKKTIIILGLVALNVDGMNETQKSVKRAIQERLSVACPIRGPDYDRGVKGVVFQKIEPIKEEKKEQGKRAIQERLSAAHPIRGPDYDRGIRSVMPEGVKPAEAPAPVVAAPVVAPAPVPAEAPAPAPVVEAAPAPAEAPAEAARLQEQQAAEYAARLQEQKAAEAARLQEQKAAEAARLKEQKAAEAARLQEQKAAEAARLKEQKAAEYAARLQEQKAAEAARLKEQKAAEYAARLQEQKAAPQAAPRPAQLPASGQASPQAAPRPAQLPASGQASPKAAAVPQQSVSYSFDDSSMTVLEGSMVLENRSWREANDKKNNLEINKTKALQALEVATRIHGAESNDAKTAQKEYKQVEELYEAEVKKMSSASKNCELIEVEKARRKQLKEDAFLADQPTYGIHRTVFDSTYDKSAQELEEYCKSLKKPLEDAIKTLKKKDDEIQDKKKALKGNQTKQSSATKKDKSKYNMPIQKTKEELEELDKALPRLKQAVQNQANSWHYVARELLFAQSDCKDRKAFIDIYSKFRQGYEKVTLDLLETKVALDEMGVCAFEPAKTQQAEIKAAREELENQKQEIVNKINQAVAAFMESDLEGSGFFMRVWNMSSDDLESELTSINHEIKEFNRMWDEGSNKLLFTASEEEVKNNQDRQQDIVKMLDELERKKTLVEKRIVELKAEAAAQQTALDEEATTEGQSLLHSTESRQPESLMTSQEDGSLYTAQSGAPSLMTSQE